MPRFRDAATGWHRRNKQRNSILIWVVLPALKLILLAARPPVSSIAFLRLFLRHHFVGSWLSRYTMETALFSILLPTTEHFLRADWVDTPWRQLCLASYYLQQNIPEFSWQRRAQIKQKAWPMEKRQIGHRKSCLVLSTRFPVAKLRFRPVAKSSYYRQWVNGLSQTRTQSHHSLRSRRSNGKIRTPITQTNQSGQGG